MKVLLAEDENDLREVIAAYLEHRGFYVTAVSNGREALDKAGTDAYDAIIMDVMMPVMDGLSAMRHIRETGNTVPALFLTAKAQVADRVEGLDAGADDYLTKPFALEELAARLRALNRRAREYQVRKMTFGGLELDMEAAELKGRNTIGLAHKEVKLLSCLIANTDRDMTTDELISLVWTGEKADAGTVWMYVSFLRDKLRAVQAGVTIEGDRDHAWRLKETEYV